VDEIMKRADDVVNDMYQRYPKGTIYSQSGLPMTDLSVYTNARPWPRQDYPAISNTTEWEKIKQKAMENRVGNKE
jgi:hypothetical protein